MDRIGSEVERELTRSGSRDAVPLAAITSAWPGAVGETVARQAWPLRIGRDGTLHVATTSATWAFELHRLSEEILGRLSSRVEGDAPPRLRFAVGPVPESGPPSEGPQSSARETPAPTPEEIGAADAAAAAIDDPDLRALVARAARASLAKSRSDRGF